MGYIHLRRAEKLLRKSLPDLHVGYDLLFLRAVEHILRCFVLETTFAMRGRAAYFWRVLFPLYRPSGMLVVNYGERLLGGESVGLLENELDRTIERLAEILRADEIDRLQAIKTPQDFLQHVDWAALPSTPNYRIDLALTLFMCGDSAGCQNVLDELVGGPPRLRWRKQMELAHELARECREDPPALRSRIERWEQGAIVWLHLAPPARRRAREG